MLENLLQGIVDPISNTGSVSPSRALSLSSLHPPHTAQLGGDGEECACTSACPPLELSVSIDSISLLWDDKERFDMLGLLKEYLMVEFDFTRSIPKTIGVRWDNSYRGSLGCLYANRKTPNGIRHRLSIPGKVCSSVPLPLLLRFIETVYNQNPDICCSRIDICLDDFTKRLTYEDIHAALKEKNYSGFVTSRSIENDAGRSGWTHYLGSRESNHMVRIYDKSTESRGRVDSIRWESEYKDEKSQAIFESLAKSATVIDAHRLLCGHIFGNINFIDKKDRNLKRCSMLTWWAEFLEYVDFQRCQVLCKKPVTSIESSVKWVHKQVEKTLARLSRVFGVERFQEFINDCVVSGSRRLKKIDDLMIVEYMNIEFGQYASDDCLSEFLSECS